MAICRVKIFQLNTLIFREMEHIIWNSEISAELRADRAYFTFPLFVWFLNSVCLNEAYKKAAKAVECISWDSAQKKIFVELVETANRIFTEKRENNTFTYNNHFLRILCQNFTSIRELQKSVIIQGDGKITGLVGGFGIKYTRGNRRWMRRHARPLEISLLDAAQLFCGVGNRLGT